MPAFAHIFCDCLFLIALFDCFFLKIGFHHRAQADFELSTPLPQSLGVLDYRCVTLGLAYLI